MFFTSLLVLVSIMGWIHYVTNKNTRNSLKSNAALRKLQHKYFIVYFPAVFADWLQGPFLYKLYSFYGFSDDEIFFLYFAGFASSVSFGTCVSCLADYIGRKKMCIIFDIMYSIACLTKIFNNFELLLMGRVLSGIGSSVLFTVFEAWYIHHHIEKEQLPASWISDTFSKSTYYNGLLAIVAGIVSHVLVDIFSMGMVFPFLLAIPCLIFSAVFALYLWDETFTIKDCCNSNMNMKKIHKNLNCTFISVCFIQSVFESVMYVFVILWTPILSPIEPPLGVVFSCFMLCIMIGSSIYKWLTIKRYTSKSVLTIAMLLGSIALLICVFSLSNYFNIFYPYNCFFSFLLYEVAVGLYFPAIGFIRSCIIPEYNRAGLASWFRVPMNIITCFSLLYFRKGGVEKLSATNSAFSLIPFNLSSNQVVFALSAFALFCTSGVCRILNVKTNQEMSSIPNINVY